VCHDGSYSGKRPQLLAVQIALFSDEHPDKCPAPESDAPSRSHAALPLGEQQSDGDLRRQVGSHDRTTMLNKHLHWIERKKEIVLGGSMM